MTELMTVPAVPQTATAPVVESTAASSEKQDGEQFMTLHSVPAANPVTPISEPVGTESTVGLPTANSAAVGEASVDAREQARTVWQASAATGEPLTGLELGERFDRSERWGRARIAEARHTNTGTDTAGTPVPARRRRTVAGTPRGTTTTGTGTTPAQQDTDDASTHDRPAVAGDRHHAAAVAQRSPDRPADPAVPDVPAVSADVPAVVLPAGARLVAWAGFLFGSVISVAANVLHAWLPTLAGQAGAPGLAPQVGAAVWPIALVISVEVLSRVPWRPGWTWQLARYGGAGVVAVGAAVISYGHLHGVLAAWGYGTTGAAVGPLVVDGLMTISGFALLAMSNHTGNGAGKAVS